MDPIVIRPDRYRQFGAAEDSTFCLVTNSAIRENFRLEPEGGYRDYRVLVMDREGQINEMFASGEIPEPAHVLVISPLSFFRSPQPESLGPRRKLIAMACNSTPTSLEAIAHFLRIIERTDPYGQLAFAERFFERGPEADYMEMIDETYGTRAVFQHLSDDYEWNQQAGPLEWGEQQLAPAGEVSVLPADIWDFNNRLRLSIDGEVVFRGLPILHSGEVSFLREDQERIFDKLRRMHEAAVIARVENGAVMEVRAAEPAAEPAQRMLETMFEVDSRFRVIWELGFAINTEVELLWDNVAMNEVYGGTNGCLHFGLGLTPYTQFHLDIICPGTKILAPNGELLFGGAPNAAKAAE
ncbi:hypothetical protein AY600_14120 [Phormidium willei BDU 130791]|nr:hypothetical protein AY600_14120 [Phormidium willei BDU 130791]